MQHSAITNSLFHKVVKTELNKTQQTWAVLYDTSGSVEGSILEHIKAICAVIKSASEKEPTWISWNKESKELHYSNAVAGGWTEPHCGVNFLHSIEKRSGSFHNNIVVITDGVIGNHDAEKFAQSMSGMNKCDERNLHTILVGRFNDDNNVNELNGVDASICNVLFKSSSNSAVFASSITGELDIRPIMSKGAISNGHSIRHESTYGSLSKMEIKDLNPRFKTNVPSEAVSDGSDYVIVEDFLKMKEVNEELPAVIRLLNNPAYYQHTMSPE
jgi:hypothetical protein